MFRERRSGISNDRHIGQPLLVAVSHEEKALRAAVDDARAQAERIVAEASRVAAERVQSMRDSMPQLVRQTIDEKLKQVQAKVSQRELGCPQEISALQETAKRNMDKAMTLIMSVVVEENGL